MNDDSRLCSAVFLILGLAAAGAAASDDLAALSQYAAADLPVPDPGPEVPAFETTFYSDWHDGLGLRFRLVFRESRGVTWSDPSGFHAAVPGRQALHMPAKVPAALRGRYAVYLKGDHVDFSLEVQNTGRRPLERLTASCRQESAHLDGESGPPLPGLSEVEPLGVIAPGQTASVAGRFDMADLGDRPINLQQTHVVIAQQTPGKAPRILADVPQAGVIDPPRFEP